MLHVRRSYVVIALKSEGGKEITSILADKYCIILINEAIDTVNAGVTRKCRLSWLTNSALVYEPKWGGGGGYRFSANEYGCAHGAQINFGDLLI
jgi:hypothetical protein